MMLMKRGGGGKRFVVRADERLTAFLELERAVCLRLLSDHQELTAFLEPEAVSRSCGELACRSQRDLKNNVNVSSPLRQKHCGPTSAATMLKRNLVVRHEVTLV